MQNQTDIHQFEIQNYIELQDIVDLLFLGTKIP